MRRMATTNQLNYINELNKILKIQNNELSIKNSDGYGLNIAYNNDTIINSGRYLSLSFNGEDGAFTIDDEESGVQYIQCYHDLVFLPSLPTSDPQIAGSLWNDNGTLKISAGK